jgi:hypothetical protein
MDQGLFECGGPRTAKQTAKQNDRYRSLCRLTWPSRPGGRWLRYPDSTPKPAHAAGDAAVSVRT